MKTTTCFIALVALFFVTGLTACSDGLTQLVVEDIEDVDVFEFSATGERTSYLGGGVASHNSGVLPQPEDFQWLDSEPSTADTAQAHSLGVSWGFGGIQPDEEFSFEYTLSWLNGETREPFRHQGLVTMSMFLLNEKGLATKVDQPFMVQQVNPNRYRVSLTAPSTTDGSYYYLSFIAGLTVECSSGGRKSFVVRDITYEGTHFSAGEVEGSMIFHGACRPILPDYH